MNAKDFISAWAELVEQERVRAEAAGVPKVADDLLLVTALPTIFDDPGFSTDAAKFLVEAGLPRSCAPFLSFKYVGRGPQSLLDLYGLHQLGPAEAACLSPFYVIGFDGGGNPLCLDSAHGGEIVMLDHEDRFRTRTFVASSIGTLAEALLLVHTAPHAEFVERLRAFDPRAAEESAFLPTEVGMLND